MTESFFSQLSEQAGLAFEQASKLQQAMLNNLGKMTEFHMERLKNYTELAAAQAKELGEVRDLESLKGFVASQAEFMTSVSKKLLEDWKELGDMASVMREDVEQVFNVAPVASDVPAKAEASPVVAAEEGAVSTSQGSAKSPESKPRQKGEAKAGSETQA